MSCKSESHRLNRAAAQHVNRAGDKRGLNCVCSGGLPLRVDSHAIRCILLLITGHLKCD